MNTPQECREPASDNDVLRSLVDEINRIEQGNTLATALAVGRLVIQAMPSLRGTQPSATTSGAHPTFRALAKHPALNMSHARLWHSVKVTLQLARLPAETCDLPYTHHKNLLGAPCDQVRTDLALRAVRENWTAEDLRKQVAEHRIKRSRGGRTPTADSRRALRDLQSAVDRLSGSTRTSLFRGLNGDEIGEVVLELRATTSRLADCLRSVEREVPRYRA